MLRLAFLLRMCFYAARETLFVPSAAPLWFYVTRRNRWPAIVSPREYARLRANEREELLVPEPLRLR